MEIVVFGVEVGCGLCVDQLLDSLSNLTALINTGFDLLSSSGSVELLRLGIEDVEVQYVKHCCIISAKLIWFM